MFQFTPLLLSHCMYLLTSGNVDGSSVQTGVIMCMRWCERRSWCSEAIYDPNSLQCSSKTKTNVSPGLAVIPVQQHICEKCPEHHVCLRTRSGATKCVKEDTRESKQDQNSPSQGISKEGKHSALDTMQKCRENITYVQLLKPRVTGDVVFYDPFATCPTDEQLKSYTELVGMFDIDCFTEQKIYYWLMTIEIDSTVALKQTLSFEVGVANVRHVDSRSLRYFKAKRITVTVDEKSITFKSTEKTSKRRSTGPDEFVVVLDKIKGRLFLGTREVCYAMVDGDLLSLYDISPFVVYPRGHPPTLNKLLFDSIGDDVHDVTNEDVKNLMRRCEGSF